MSRIGKYPVAVPDKVRSDRSTPSGVTVKGPLGTLEHDVSPCRRREARGEPT